MLKPFVARISAAHHFLLARRALEPARQYLYITIYELLLDSLAAEHGMRLIAAKGARQWIDETRQSVHRQLSAVRRENSTQEVLDIVAGSKRVKHDSR